MNLEPFKIVDTENADHYIWGDNCDGWRMVNTESLSVIRETMPGNTKEKLHYHEKAQQFFYILNGTATFEIEGNFHQVPQGKGIWIKPGIKHRIENKTTSNLEFIVISEPRTQGDRINLD